MSDTENKSKMSAEKYWWLFPHRGLDQLYEYQQYALTAQGAVSKLFSAGNLHKKPKS